MTRLTRLAVSLDLCIAQTWHQQLCPATWPTHAMPLNNVLLLHAGHTSLLSQSLQSPATRSQSILLVATFLPAACLQVPKAHAQALLCRALMELSSLPVLARTSGQLHQTSVQVSFRCNACLDCEHAVKLVPFKKLHSYCPCLATSRNCASSHSLS